MHHEHDHKVKVTDATADGDKPRSSTDKENLGNADEKADAQSIAQSSVLGITRLDELDPVALNSAFKFAAWSSVALVRPLIHRFCSALIAISRSPFRP